MLSRFAWLTLCGLCLGCAQSAIDRNQQLAASGGASRSLISTDEFRHVVFTRTAAVVEEDLHIYLGGDGQAFIKPNRVASDPTPLADLALKLMLLDDTDALYVARPCYHGTARDSECGPIYWTLDRFSKPVIDSMVMAVSSLIEPYSGRRITLIGYSGGGVIAMLVASHLSMPVTVVTIAAPLDVDAWLNHHGYTPLRNSSNPANTEQWPMGMKRVHFFGAEDLNVPTWTQTEALSTMRDDDQLRVMTGYDHNCCWLENWPQLIRSLER